MSVAEIPYSVRVEPNDSPDKTSVAVGNEYAKVVEPQGLSHNRNPDRKFIFQQRGLETSVTFHPNQDLDTLVFHRENSASRYVSRNGIYVELGIISSQGKGMGRFDVFDGTRSLTQVDLSAFPYFRLATSLKTQKIEELTKALETFKLRPTPPPDNFLYASNFIQENLCISESYDQPALFEI